MGLLEYRHPYVTVDLLLFSVIDNSLAICLTKRDEEPFKGMYSLPGTFIHEDESGEGAVERLLADKLQIPKQIYVEQLQTFSDLYRDPRERVISIAYIGIIPEKEMVDISWMHWFIISNSNVDCLKLTSLNDEDKLLSSELGFDHGKMLNIALNRLRGKIDYTDILFKFIQEKQCFTASDLRNIYQAVAGKEVNRGNFTKYQMNTYISTGLIKKTGTQSVGRGRPADTYTYTGGEKLWIRS